MWTVKFKDQKNRILTDKMKNNSFSERGKKDQLL